MEISSEEISSRNKKFVVKYGLILLGASILLFIFGVTVKPNIPLFFQRMMGLPFPTFALSWILMIICFQLQIITKYDFLRTFKNKKVDGLVVTNGDVLKVWFWIQSFLGFFGHFFYFGANESNLKAEGNDGIILILISISPTILFIISSFFARMNRIENK